MTTAADATLALIDALVRLSERGPKGVSTLTGAEVRPVAGHPRWIRYQGRSATGPFRAVELRADREGSGGIVIVGEPVERVTDRELDLRRYGPQRSLAIEPPNASSWSARYACNGLTLEFTFQTVTDELISAVFERP